MTPDEQEDKSTNEPVQTAPEAEQFVDNPDSVESETEVVQQSEAFEPVSWEASEYIHHERDTVWGIAFVAVTIVLLTLAVFVMKSYTFAALILVMAAALGIYAKRPPHVLKYELSSQGFRIGQKFYSFNDFRSFGILHDGALYSVLLFPTARFAPTSHVYFPEGNGEEIVDILASYLPMEDVHFDMVDSLLRRLRL